MKKIIAAGLAFCGLVVCAVQSYAAHPVKSETDIAKQTKHFRLSFVITYPGGQPSESYALDVPVSIERAGTASITMASGPAGQEVGSVKESLQCLDVHESAQGLAAEVSFVVDRVSAAPPPDANEPLHNQFTINHKVDLVLGKASTITEETRGRSLDKSGTPAAVQLQAAPKIMVTAMAL